jgi:hypothetical protein
MEQERAVELALMTSAGDPYALVIVTPDGALRYGAGMWTGKQLVALLERFRMLVGMRAWEEIFGAGMVAITGESQPRVARNLREASGLPAMRRAQRMILRESLMGPVIIRARRLGINTLKGLAEAFALAWRQSLMAHMPPASPPVRHVPARRYSL